MENMHKRHVPLKGVSALILRCLIAIKYLRICRSIPTRDYSDCTFVQTNRGPSPVVHFILCFKVCFPVRDRSIRLLSRDTTNHILLDTCSQHLIISECKSSQELRCLYELPIQWAGLMFGFTKHCSKNFVGFAIPLLIMWWVMWPIWLQDYCKNEKDYA